MARLAVTVTVLFFLFSFSTARSPLDLSENGVIDRDPSNSQPESDAMDAILLPSEKPESESLNDAEIKFEATEIQPDESNKDLPESETKTIDEVPLTQPLTVVNFRPVNRHFQLKRPFSFHFSHRGCGHRFKAMNPRFHGREISYGNDMILSGENSDFDPTMFHGGIRRHHHHHHHHHHEDGMPRLPFKHHHMFEKENFKRPFRHEEEEEREDKDREERDEGGFMMRFRKFLNHF